MLMLEGIFSKVEKMEQGQTVMQIDITELKQGQARLETKVTALQTDVEELKQGQARLETKVAGIETDVEELKQGQARLEIKVAGLETKVTNLEIKVTRLETNLSGFKVILENETERNIRIIAEGHEAIVHRLDTIQPVVEILEEDVSIIKGAVSSHFQIINKKAI